MNELTHAQYADLLTGRAGLIVGTAATQIVGSQSDLARKVANILGLDSHDDYRKVIDSAFEKDMPRDMVLKNFNETFAEIKASPLVNHLAKGKWSSILSATLDTFLEDKLQSESAKHPSSRRVSTLNDLSAPVPPRTIPVFKLLGTANRDDFAVSTSSYTLRKIKWRACLSSFVDQLKGNPILCVGMSDFPDILIDLIGELIAQGVQCPRHLLLISDDPLIQNRKLAEICNGRINLCKVPGSLGELVRTAIESEKTGYTASLDLGKEKENPFGTLLRFIETCVVVNTQVETPIEKEQVAILQDLLFSPSVPRWDPFVYSMDFYRTLTLKFESEIERLIASRQVKSFVATLCGNAATGKTTLLKRLALNLARKSHLVIWIRHSYLPDSHRQIRELFREIANNRDQYTGGVVCFLDDLIGFSSVTPGDVVRIAQNAGVNVAVIVGIRNSDAASFESTRLYGDAELMLQEELPDSFDNVEWRRLPEYLVEIGKSKNKDEAENLCEHVERTLAHDVLCMMYTVLLETKDTITSSIRSEYFRIGDNAAFKKLILGAKDESAEILQQAYEMVAVSDFYQAPIPIEVLVAALGVDYSEWLDATSKNVAAWGVLYSEQDEQGNVYYRTRNFIVTKILIETLNGGSLGHSGELRVLQTLVAGCKGRSGAVYREFLARLLISNEHFNRLEYEEGLSLYDNALNSLSFPDRTLVHHKGLWIRKKGRDPIRACEIFEQALQTPIFPYADRVEATEHIHTSYAAATIEAIDQGRLTVEVGKDKVLEHLSKARSLEFFNPNAVHVQGGLVLRLVKHLNPGDVADTFAFLNKAVSDIDRTVAVLKNASSGTHQNDAMLEDMMAKLFAATVDAAELISVADRLWNELGNQEGFVLLLRRTLFDARKQDKGTLFNAAFKHYLEIVQRIERDGSIAVSSLHEVGLEIIYSWHIRRASHSAEIDWQMIQNLATKVVVGKSNNGHYILHRYVLALALAHLGKWPEALQVFSDIRATNMPGELLWKPRNFLLDASGKARVLQAKLHQSAERRYAHIEDLKRDFLANRGEDWPRNGEYCFPHLRFSFGGPTATLSATLDSR